MIWRSQDHTDNGNSLDVSHDLPQPSMTTFQDHHVDRTDSV
jgi:hypothetical protein